MPNSNPIIKLQAVKTSSGKIACYDWQNWRITKHGGFITVTRWTAVDGSMGSRWFWKFTRKEVVETLAQLEAGMSFDEIPELYRKPLYS